MTQTDTATVAVPDPDERSHEGCCTECARLTTEMHAFLSDLHAKLTDVAAQVAPLVEQVQSSPLLAMFTRQAPRP